jgi:hypothetical protein
MIWHGKTDAPNFLPSSATYGNAFKDASEKSVANRIFFSAGTCFGTV